MLSSATKDGGKKRASGAKVSWKIDPEHEAAIFSHLSAWKHGVKVDKDSGAHPLVHLAWRALAVAYQENKEEYLKAQLEHTYRVAKEPMWSQESMWSDVGELASEQPITSIYERYRDR